MTYHSTAFPESRVPSSNVDSRIVSLPTFNRGNVEPQLTKDKKEPQLKIRNYVFASRRLIARKGNGRKSIDTGSASLAGAMNHRLGQRTKVSRLGCHKEIIGNKTVSSRQFGEAGG